MEKLMRIAISFDELRIMPSRLIEFQMAWAGADLDDLDDTLLYSQINERWMVSEFDGAPIRFDNFDEFASEFRQRIVEIAVPFSLPLH